MKKVALLILLVLMSAPTLSYQSDAFSKGMSDSTQDQIDIFFEKQPKNPLTTTDMMSYSDKELSKEKQVIAKEQLLEIKHLLTNDQGQTVFELNDGTYILASQNNIIDDVPTQLTSVDETYWLPEEFTFYDTPKTSQSKQQSTSLNAFEKVHVIAKANTYAGEYSQIENQGWVKTSDLSTTDNRMQKVQNVLTQKYNKKNYAIYVKQLATQEEAGINSNMMMYSASISKLPILYYTQEQLDSGKITLNTRYSYTDSVNNFSGAYDPSGSGEMAKTADNKDYDVSYLIDAVASDSDNVASNMLSYYVTDKYGKAFDRTLDKLSISWNMQSREVSPKTAGLMMEALYEQNGTVIKALSHTHFDTTRIAKNIPVAVAHKIGDAYDYKHDVAIVYTESPFILSIFTNDATYDDITAIADDVYAILK